MLSKIVGRQSEGSLIRGFNPDTIPNPITDPNPNPDPNSIPNSKSYRRVISH